MFFGGLLAHAAITDGLVGYWPFDEITGTVAAEVTTNGNAGQLQSFPGDNSQWVAGRVARALEFSGPASGDYVLVPQYPKPTTSITVAAWVWADARPTWASIAKNWGGSQAGQFHFGLTSTAGDLSIYLTTASGAQFSVRENTPLPVGSWQHVAFTADGATLRLFRNGAEVASAPCSGALKTTGMNALGLGVKLNDAGTAPDASSPGHWQGKLDDLGLWNRALNSAEISALVAAGLLGRGLTNAESVPVITGGGVRISEFMAGNQSTLRDDFGESSDWIELHNDTPATVNLAGWSLTDKASSPTQWIFPSTNLPAGGFLVVFASNRDRLVPGQPLHTNFKLAAEGEYLALARPDGSIATRFAPVFPPQVTDVSFGFGLETGSLTLVGPGTVGRVLVPQNGSLDATWTTTGFDDTAWRAATNGVGYDVGTVTAGTGYADDVFADTPPGYWRLAEAGGSWATNRGSLAPVGNGQWSGSVTPGVPGPRPPSFPGFEPGNLAAHFDGATGLMAADYTPDLNPSGPFTVECWVRPAWTSSTACPLSSQTYSGSSREGYLFYQNLVGGANQWEFRLGDGAGYVAVAAGGAVQTNAWQHLAGVYAGSNAVLFVNGVPVATTSLSRAFAPNRSQPFRLGLGGGARYPFNGDVDEVAVLNRALSTAEVAQRYRIATNGGGGTTNFIFTSLIHTDLQPAMFGSNATAWFRIPFTLTNAAEVTRLTLRLNYDDGFTAYLNGVAVASDNAPTSLAWNSAAPADRADELALEEAVVDLSGWRNLLQDGTNVLALHGLNFGATNGNFLLLAGLDAVTGQYAAAPAYFTTPTPGGPNGAGTPNLGPIFSSAGHTPAVPGTNDSLTVTCRVTQAFAPVAGVTLRWRVMYGATNSAPMFDDGGHGDGAAGDGVYGATITNRSGADWVFAGGQMVRWCFTATDSQGRTSRWPRFASPTDSSEYLGTVVQPEAVTTSALPVLHWFVENSSAADTDTGTRCSLFYRDQFMDNLFVRIRGGTSRSWPKKSHKFEMNSGERLLVTSNLPAVSEFNLNTTYTDKSYVRSLLASEHQRDAGLPTPDTFLMHVRQNGQFHSLALYVEQPNEDFLRRNNFDREGALYKALGSPLGTYEKKTRTFEDTADLQALLAGLNLTGVELEKFLFDHVNLANVVNFMATVAVTQNIDASDKNHFLYRDTNGTREWRLFPWDLDLTFGPDYLNTDTIVASLCDTGAPHCPSHPFIGARPWLLHGGKYHPLLEAVVNTPRARQMLLRRLRTLTDQFLATNYFQDRIETLFPLLEPDVQLDHALWGANAHFPGQSYTLRQALDRLKNEYLAPRLAFLNSGTIPGIGAALPPAQPTNAVIVFGALDFNPASGNQDEEFVQLLNTNAFAVDLSGWQFGGAARMAFESGTVIPAGDALYVTPNAAAFRARATGPRGGQGLLVQGNCDGHLNAWGETLTLADAAGRPVASLSYSGAPSPAQRFLRVTEIMYHPVALPGNTNDAEQFEFLELKNISADTALDLTEVKFTEGIGFNFTGSAVTSLAPGGIVVLVRNLAAFLARYGSLGLPSGSLAGPYTGALDNSGERLRLEDAHGEKILEFSYDNNWYPSTDGLGYSLVIVNELAPWDTWGLASSWRPSGRLQGSPGTSELPPAPQLTGITRDRGGTAVTLTTAAGFTYFLEAKEVLSQTQWQTLSPPRVGTGGTITMADTNAPAAQRFYRIRAQ